MTFALETDLCKSPALVERKQSSTTRREMDRNPPRRSVLAPALLHSSAMCEALHLGRSEDETESSALVAGCLEIAMPSKMC